ncbi:MAG: hypothetical protein J6X43_05350, partial [Bacteroidales bacterium]|nr:hypothetical protein [Bacteroidales bacterium]
MNIFQKTFSRNLIYVFRINDDAHNNLLKIGKATISSDIPDEQLLPNCDALNEAARNRINEYTSAS